MTFAKFLIYFLPFLLILGLYVLDFCIGSELVPFIYILFIHFYIMIHVVIVPLLITVYHL